MKKVIRFINIAFFILTIVLTFIFREQIKTYKELFSSLYTLLIIILLSIFTFLFIITPIHEFLHLLVYNPNISSRKSNLLLQNGTVSAHYDGEISKNKCLMSLVLLCVVITTILTIILSIMKVQHL